MRARKCLRCGGVIDSANPKRKYCSEKCRRSAERVRLKGGKLKRVRGGDLTSRFTKEELAELNQVQVIERTYPVCEHCGGIDTFRVMKVITERYGFGKMQYVGCRRCGADARIYWRVP